MLTPGGVRNRQFGTHLHREGAGIVALEDRLIDEVRGVKHQSRVFAEVDGTCRHRVTRGDRADNESGIVRFNGVKIRRKDRRLVTRVPGIGLRETVAEPPLGDVERAGLQFKPRIVRFAAVHLIGAVAGDDQRLPHVRTRRTDGHDTGTRHDETGTVGTHDVAVVDEIAANHHDAGLIARVFGIFNEDGAAVVHRERLPFEDITDVHEGSVGICFHDGRVERIRIVDVRICGEVITRRSDRTTDRHRHGEISRAIRIDPILLTVPRFEDNGIRCRTRNDCVIDAVVHGICAIRRNIEYRTGRQREQHRRRRSIFTHQRCITISILLIPTIDGRRP